MAEHEPPADLLDKLKPLVESARHAIERHGPSDRFVASDIVLDTLAALAEWADGALVDPSTWTRVTVDEVYPADHDWDSCGFGHHPHPLPVTLTREDHADPT